MKKNGVLTFIFALLPGCGQMYQGYMRRGVSLLFWFCGIIAASVLTRLEFILVVLPVIWAYSFFDAFNIRSLSPEQRAAFGDNYLPGSFSFGKRWENGSKSRRGIKIAGWALLAVGVIILYNNLWDALYWELYNYFPVLASWLNRLPAFAIGVVVIVLGVLMLRGGKNPPQDEEYQDFTGGDTDDGKQ